MDNLKSLFDKKEYKLIIDITESSYDYDSLSYRLNSFLALGDNNNALNLLNDTKANLILYNLNPKVIIKLHASLLKEKGDINLLIEKYNEYISRPYISQEIEEILKDFVKIKNNNLNKEKDINYYINNLLNSNNDDLILESLVFLKKDYKNYIDELIKFLNREKVASQFKTFALFMLIEAKVDINIDFYKDRILYKLNPSKLSNPYSLSSYKEVSDYIKTLVKNVSIINIGIDLFNNYIIDVFPILIEDKYKDLKILSAAFILEAKRRLADKEDEEKYITNLGVDYRNTLDYLFKVKEDLKV